MTSDEHYCEAERLLSTQQGSWTTSSGQAWEIVRALRALTHAVLAIPDPSVAPAAPRSGE